MPEFKNVWKIHLEYNGKAKAEFMIQKFKLNELPNKDIDFRNTKIILKFICKN